MEVLNCIFIHILQLLINAYMTNTFEIIFKGSLSCIQVTHPEMRDHISNRTSKSEVLIQHKDMTPCSLED